ncbi:MAG: deoxycytidylate deaminase [Ktedonobacteraceae bacterium]
MINSARPSWDDYFVEIAHSVSHRANCLRRKVGALIVVEHRIISTGYNGTPFGVKNCNEGGCLRCASNAPRHQGYEICLCVHAEQNAIILAARQGTSTDNASLYTTLRPCLDCLKVAIQAGIREIVYDLPFGFNEPLEEVYNKLLTETSLIVRRNPLTEPLETSVNNDNEIEVSFDISEEKR